jgi:hypothetical protein
MNYFDISGFPREVQSRVERELASGEKVEWMGQPIPRRLAKASWPIVVFGIPWTAFALFWTAGAAWGTSKTGVGLLNLFPLFGIPFILVGLGMLSSPFWIKRAAKGTAYVITDRRAIVIQGGWRGTVNVRSFEPERLVDLRRKEHADGSGDLVFTQDIRRDSDGDRHTTEVGFMAIADVKSVEEIVKALVVRTR